MHFRTYIHILNNSKNFVYEKSVSISSSRFNDHWRKYGGYGKEEEKVCERKDLQL